MKRIIMMLLRNFFYLPITWIRMTYYVNHRERYTEEELYRFLREIDEHAIQRGNITIEAYGKENLPQKNGFMMYPNHQGMFDVLALINVCDMPISVVAKKEVGNIPVLRKVFRLMQAKLIDRGDVKQSVQVIMEVAKEVKEGRNYIIFPEGTRSKKGNQTQEFKGGSFKSATRARCPIVPVALIDSYKAFDTGSVKEQIVQVHILPPMLYEEYKDMKTVEIAAVVRERIDEVLKTA